MPDINSMKQLEPDSVTEGDKLIVRVAVDVAVEDFAALELQHFEELKSVMLKHSEELKAFFAKVNTPALCHTVSTVAIWIAIQMALSGFDSIEPPDLVDSDDPEQKARLEGLLGSLRTDWRSSVILSLVKELLGGYRRAQQEDNALPADLKLYLERVDAANKAGAH